VKIPGLLNPRSTLQTSSFILETLNIQQNVIDRLATQLEVQMVRPGELTEFIVTPESLRNGEETNYSFLVKTNTPMLDKDRITFTFPPEVNFGQLPKCRAESDNLISISCAKFGKTFTAVLIFVNGEI
jgi:hypothetical protein